MSVDWHPNEENIFVSGSMDRNLVIWNKENKEPIKIYKSSHGTSKIKWYHKNPKYFFSSYQTSNPNASMWNLDIDNMPEYIFKGHKEVVSGFCTDKSEKGLITCSNDGFCYLHNLDSGFRPVDNLCTNFTRFTPFGDIISFNEKKPKKMVK